VSTVKLPRSNVSVEEVIAVLHKRLGARYRITPSVTSSGFGKEAPDDANTMLVKGKWFDRANVRILPGTDSIEIEVSPGATYFGLIRLLDRVGSARKVHQALEQSPELAGSD
jgi:hypothetical protein